MQTTTHKLGGACKCATTNNSSTIEYALINVTSDKAVIANKLPPHTNIAIMLFVCNQDLTTKLCAPMSLVHQTMA